MLQNKLTIVKCLMPPKQTGVGKVMILLKFFNYLNVTIGNIVTKLLKYGIFIAAFIIFMIVITDTKPIDVINYLTHLSIEQKGLGMQTTKWKEFDFTDIAGEEQAVIFGGMEKAEALLNYRIYTFYPFDGDVGFVLGSNYDKQEELYNTEVLDKKSITQKEYDMYWPDKHETAYIFRTGDDGKTFTEHTLGNGFAAEVVKYKKNYYALVEDYLCNAKTFVSKDKGESWSLFYPASIEAFFDDNRFIFSKPTGVKTVQSVSRFEYFYTKDGGKTSIPLSNKIMEYAKNMHAEFERNFRLVFNVYEGKLLFIDGDFLVSIDVDTQKEDRTPLKFPKGYKLASYPSMEYGENLLEQYKTRDRNRNILQINKENGKPYIVLQKEGTGITEPAQISIWYPFENKHIVFNKKVSMNIPLKVSGDYIGGFVKKNGILIHVWTLNDGKDWHYESLPDYYLLVGPKVMHNRIWMTALVRGERPDKKEGYPKVKGSFLVMGTLKSDTEKNPKDFSSQKKQ